MKRQFYGLAIAFSLCASVAADGPTKPRDDVVMIPLDEIWAYDMPGTRDIRDLEPEQSQKHLESLPAEEQRRLIEKRLWIPIATALSADSPGSDWPREGETARPGFAVEGIGGDALRAVHEVLVDDDKPKEQFPADAEISLAFFSYQIGTFVHIQNVIRRDNEIEIQYCFVGHGEKFVSAHLALIPLGELSPGKYTVKIVQLPTRQQSLDDPSKTLSTPNRYPLRRMQAGRRFVSQPFSFYVLRNGGTQ